MRVLPPNPLSGVLSGSKASGGSNLPPNPLTPHLAGTTTPVAPQQAAPPVHHLAPGGLEQLNQETIHASAPTVAQYNRESGTQQHGVLPVMKAADLRSIREQAAKNPQAAALGGIVDPVDWVVGAVKGAGQLAHGVSKVAHGDLTGGGKEAGLGALGVAGIIPGLGKFGDILREARTPEEAAAHIDDAIAKAKVVVASKGKPPLIEKGASTPETGGELGRQVREGLLKAPAIRKVQKAGYSEERGARFQAAGEARVKAGGGLAGQAAAKRQLKDALPREFFGEWKHFTPQHVEQLTKMIDKAPLQEGERTHAIDTITNAVDHGIVPPLNEQRILERVFGKVAGAPAEPEAASFWDKFVSYTNIPRALRSSGDLSAGLRQGLVVLVTHPKVWARAFTKSVKFFGSEDYYQAANAAMESDKWFPLLQKWGVPFTDLDGKVSNTEEAYIGSQAAEHLHELPGIKGTPVGTALKPLSNIIRRSDRAFTGFQNETRFEMAKMLGEKAALLGHDLNDEKLGESIARVVGTFSGRGVTPKILEGHLTTLNALMFSPRLMASRLNLMSPVYYYKLDPFARQEALNGARNLVAAIGTVMLAAKMAGAEVNFDPRSSNFAKIKVGHTRIDIAGGFSQQVRFAAQEITREAISSNGTKTHIGWGQHDISDLSNLTKLGRSKAAPIPGLAWDELSGKDFIGKPVKQGHEAFANAPFITQDVHDAYQNSGAKSVWIAAFLSAIGLGVQSYKDKPAGASTGGNGGGFGDSGGGFGSGDGGFNDNSGGFGG